MPTSCQICSKLLQSFLPTLHHWRRGNRSIEGTMRGDPTAKATYAIAIIHILMIADITDQDDSSAKTAAYADDFTAAQLKKSLK